MSRSCEKQGCNEPADVAFGIDRVACVVWLENFDEDEQRHLNRLCDEHAARLTLPRGWSFDDRREHSPRLFLASRPNTKPIVAGKSSVVKPLVAKSAGAKPAANVPTAKPAAANSASTKPAAKSPRKGSNKTGSIPRRTSRDTSSPVRRIDGPSLFDPTLPMNSPRLLPLPTETSSTADASTPTPAPARSVLIPTEPTSPTMRHDVDPTNADSTADVVAPDVSSGTAKPAYAPKFDRTSDVGGTLNATGRLLRRAFSSQTKPIERPRVASDTDSLPQGDHIDDFNQGEHVE